MKIYTKGGDKGKTAIRGGRRVDKDDPRIEANGCVDELNSQIGVLRAGLPANHPWQEMLYRVQYDLMICMSQIATPSTLREQNPNKLPEDMVSFLEKQIDILSVDVKDEGWFVLPGGNAVSAHCQLTRTIARRAERRLWTLNRQDALPEEILIAMNRLSDLFFMMARYEIQRTGGLEEKWKTFRGRKYNTDK